MPYTWYIGTYQHIWWCHRPEDLNIHQHGYVNLKIHIIQNILIELIQYMHLLNTFIATELSVIMK